MTWFDKKTRPATEALGGRPPVPMPKPLEVTKLMSEPTPRSSISTVTGGSRTILGRSVIAQGQIAAREDLLIEGGFEGVLTLNGHCLTVGPEAKVTAEIRARQVVVHGSVTGNITAGEKIELRRTGRVVGDLIAGTVAIEEGSYFKGSIDISRDEEQEAPVRAAAPAVMRTRA